MKTKDEQIIDQAIAKLQALGVELGEEAECDLESWNRMMVIIDHAISELSPGSEHAKTLIETRDHAQRAFDSGVAKAEAEAEAARQEAINSDDPMARFIRSIFDEIERERRLLN